MVFVRTSYIYAYIYIMKVRFNTTIDRHLLADVKVFANKKQVSVSQLIEEYFKTIIRKKPTKRKTIVDLVKSLPPPDKTAVKKSYEKQNYYEDRRKKYGF